MFHRRLRSLYKIILFFFLVAQLQFVTLLDLPIFTIPGTDIRLNPQRLSLLKPSALDGAGLSSASATLANPRLSFQGRVSTGYARGTNVITLATTPNTFGDINTNNLFPNDTVAVGINGNIPVASISSATVFTLKNALAVTVGATTNIYATQPGTLTLSFYTGAAIPVGGSIRIELPASNGSISGSNVDGAPDTTAATNTKGFDLNGMTNANVTCPNGAFAAGTLTAGAGGIGAPHIVSCNYSGAVGIPAGANLSIVIGSGTKPLVNPAPINTGHTQGLADVYPMTIYTKDAANGTGNNIESIQVRAAPIEGVLVTATVDETLSFQISGVAVGSTSFCGVAHTAGLTTTATSVPWGIVNSNYTADKNEAVQQLTVTTNAPTGYNVYAEENDQMGKDGVTCTGAAPSVGEYTFGSNTCIRDYANAATHTSATDWTAAPGSNYGFGYTLANQSGTDARFLYNNGGAYMAKQFADQENSESKYDTNADLMYNVGPVSGSSVYVCYRIHVPATQPAGFYFNKLKYTAVAKF